MDEEKQRIAIAEACGWTNISRLAPSPRLGMVESKFLRGVNPEGYRVGVPDYLDSLDAMHEAEKCLPAGIIKGGAYERSLCRLTNNPFCATAAQRAEAFLRTINKWEDEP